MDKKYYFLRASLIIDNGSYDESVIMNKDEFDRWCSADFTIKNPKYKKESINPDVEKFEKFKETILKLDLKNVHADKYPKELQDFPIMPYTGTFIPARIPHDHRLQGALIPSNYLEIEKNKGLIESQLVTVTEIDESAVKLLNKLRLNRHYGRYYILSLR